MKFWKSQQGKLLIAKRYKAAFLIAFVVILGYPAYALPIKDVQSTSSCDLFNCVTWVDLTTLGLNTQQLNAVKGMNLTKYLPKVEQYTNLKNIDYNITGNILYITGNIKNNTYWTMDLGTYVTLDPWWNASLPYCANIMINNTNAMSLTNYSKLFNITYNESMQSNFNDIRISNESLNNSGYKLPYWIEYKVDSSYADIWIKIDSLPANSIRNISYCFGNNSAGFLSESNINTTFLFGDDFSESSLVKWTIKGGTWNITNGWLYGLRATAGERLIIANDSIALNESNISVEYDYNFSYTSDANDWVLVRRQNASTYHVRLDNAIAVSNAYRIQKFNPTESSIASASTTNWTNNILYKIRFQALGNNYSAYRNGSFIVSGNDATFIRGWIGLGSYSGTSSFMKVDNFRIRTVYNITEPSYSFGNVTQYVLPKTNTTLYLNGSRANMSATNNTYINITAFCNVSANITLYQNTTLLNSSYGTTSVNSTFFNGVWLMNATVSSNDTYNGSTESWYLTIINITAPPLPYPIDTHICFKTKPVCIDTLTNKIYINGVQQ